MKMFTKPLLLKFTRISTLMMSLMISFSVFAQTIMFDDFTYTNIDDPQLSSFNKWGIVHGTSGPPEGAQYSRNNIAFINDPNRAGNRLMTLSTTVNGSTKATTHSRIETAGFDYFEGTYAARVFFSDVPFTYKDGNVQTFYTIVSSALAGDGSRYSELDFEYLAADKWGISPDNPVMYMTSWNRYIANPWQAWKRYFYSQRSWAGWHTCVVSCTDGVNVKFWIDGVYYGAMSVTDNDGSSVYPRNPMNISFANWIWNNVTGSSTANRTTTMQVDWVLFYQNQELSPTQVDNLVASYRSQGLQRRNLQGQTYITNPCTVPAQPGAISGSTSVPAGSSQTYSIAAVSGATSYTWTLPSGWSGSSTSTSITTTVGSTGGTISVRANNTCGSGTARSLNVTVTSPSTNIARGKTAVSSSNETPSLVAANAVDGNMSTRWASAYSDAQWIYVDLGASYNINRVKINWEAAYGRDYQVQVSSNASSWTTIRNVTGNTSLTNDWTGLSGTGRYVRINGTRRGTQWGYSIFELEVYGTLVSGGGFTTRIEAENYVHMSGVATQACSEGGLNVTSFDAYDWMSYNINIPTAGTYRVSYRVASPNSGRTIRLERESGAVLIGTASIPNTGGWQTWTTVHHDVYLPAGQYPIGLTTYNGGFNINWFEISNSSGSARTIEGAFEKERVENHEDKKEQTLNELVIYPNPVKNIINIRFGDKKVEEVDIVNSLGSVQKIKVQNGSINVATLKPGIYFIRLTVENETFTRKFIKQ